MAGSVADAQHLQSLVTLNFVQVLTCHNCLIFTFVLYLAFFSFEVFLLINLTNIQYLTLVDCQWSSWSQGRCSKGCGGGQRTNRRHKWVDEEHGGSCSGQSTFIESCNTHPCPGQPHYIT